MAVTHGGQVPVERSRRGWALSSGAETGAVEIAGVACVTD
jgi:hypothetical protein